MKVILKRAVGTLGDVGDVVDVADGYANNYLMPSGLALRASRGTVADAQAMGRARAKREATSVAEAEGMRAQVEEGELRIEAKAGEDQTLYGSVGKGAIVEALRQQRQLTIDRRRLNMDRPLKSLGTHEVTVRLYKDITAGLRVTIVAADAG